jgi:hypothetical protein
MYVQGVSHPEGKSHHRGAVRDRDLRHAGQPGGSSTGRGSSGMEGTAPG